MGPYIDMNTELTKKAKNYFEKEFFKLINNSVFEKTMKNVRKHTDKRRSYFISQPKYQSTKWLSENLLAIEVGTTKLRLNKPVYLGLLILSICKTLMHTLW